MANQSSRQLLDTEDCLKAFDATKAGVRGLVENGISEVPPLFVMSTPFAGLQEHGISEVPPLFAMSTPFAGLQEHGISEVPALFVMSPPFAIPAIDLKGIADDTKRKEIIRHVEIAAKWWGFFLIINHGVPTELLNEMLERNRSFHEQPREERGKYYTRDGRKNVVYNSFYDSYRKAVYWRDNVTFMAAPGFPDPIEMPEQFRDILKDYADQVNNVGTTVLELLSEALGLQKNHLIGKGCSDVLYIGGHYYPPCPQPELTYSAPIHADNNCLTLVQQDKVGGALQFLLQGQWFTVPLVGDALVVNFGSVLQRMTNDVVKSIQHRVVAHREGVRMSIRSFFTTPNTDATTILNV